MTRLYSSQIKLAIASLLQRRCRCRKRVLEEYYLCFILFVKKGIQRTASARRSGGQAQTLQNLRFYEEYNATIPFAKMISWLAPTPPIQTDIFEDCWYSYDELARRRLKNFGNLRHLKHIFTQGNHQKYPQNQKKTRLRRGILQNPLNDTKNRLIPQDLAIPPLPPGGSADQLYPSRHTFIISDTL